LVFTSLVLIHQHPDVLNEVVKEITEVSNNYIFGYEYYSDELNEIEYRGNKNVLWKQDFARIYTNQNPNLTIIKEIKYNYLNNSNIDNGFLIQKNC